MIHLIEFLFMFQQRILWAFLFAALNIGITTKGRAEPAGRDVSPVDFQTQVAPIFESRCLGCHSPNILKGDFSLATVDDALQNDWIVPGDADGSYLVELISSVDDQPPAMPGEGAPLEPQQVQTIREWIDQGAKWPKESVLREASKTDKSWWSLQPIDAPEDQTIDELVNAGLRAKGLERNPPADRRTLIRRVTYDLTGLPPTPEQMERFVADRDPLAYETLVDGLLASPRYGERWGRHWLDVVRFGESRGYERNRIIDDLHPFRDYVIESFNRDKPMDQLIREHLAGDVLSKGNPEITIGSAFLVAGTYDEVNNQDPVKVAQIRANTIDEIIRATSGAFLGLTIGCARCHDHKFDPIRQEDYYRLYSTFAGIRHGSDVWAAPETVGVHNREVAPLRKAEREAAAELKQLRAEITKTAKKNAAHHALQWTRAAADRTGTTETFDPVEAKFVRLHCDRVDSVPQARTGFGIEEFEVWSVGDVANGERQPVNVALQANGGIARGVGRPFEGALDVYGPGNVNDGKIGARFIAMQPTLTIELAEPTRIDRVVFSSAIGQANPRHRKFKFLGDYRIEISVDGKNWRRVADGADRKPFDEAHRDARLFEAEITAEQRRKIQSLEQQQRKLKAKLAKIPPLRRAFIGTRSSKDAAGPFHVFIGGSPQRKGDVVTPASLSMLSETTPEYELETEMDEALRRSSLAKWITDPKNPLTPRVLANRLWHYHFGTGIVATPNDFGFMGARPTHPRLLDYLADQLRQEGWRLKPLHRLIVLSETYRQSSDYRDEAAKLDGDSRFLWRFPPRRLSAEEIRDTVLSVAGKLRTQMGGPGFRLYKFVQDNVCEYIPLEHHGPETYRRAVYHQNARASVVDLMTDFDLPDCAFTTPKRSSTTTPLQALTMLNHSFTIEVADALAERLRSEAGSDPFDQIQRAYQLCYGRLPDEGELQRCKSFLNDSELPALCRVLLNTTELIYVR